MDISARLNSGLLRLSPTKLSLLTTKAMVSRSRKAKKAKGKARRKAAKVDAGVVGSPAPVACGASSINGDVGSGEHEGAPGPFLGEIEALKIQAAKDRDQQNKINATNEAKIKQQDRIIKGLQNHMDQQNKIIKELLKNVELMQSTAAVINQEHQEQTTTNNFNGNGPTYVISVNHYYNGMLIEEETQVMAEDQSQDSMID
jgi:hypothetical protein